jgi:hypothetical protein
MAHDHPDHHPVVPTVPVAIRLNRRATQHEQSNTRLVPSSSTPSITELSGRLTVIPPALTGPNLSRLIRRSPIPRSRQSSETSDLLCRRARATPHASCLPPETEATAADGTNRTNLDFDGALVAGGACLTSGRVHLVHWVRTTQKLRESLPAENKPVPILWDPSENQHSLSQPTRQ